MKEKWRDFPGGPEVKILRFQFRVWVPSLVGELGSHIPCGMGERKTKAQQNKQKTIIVLLKLIISEEFRTFSFAFSRLRTI